MDPCNTSNIVKVVPNIDRTNFHLSSNFGTFLNAIFILNICFNDRKSVFRLWILPVSNRNVLILFFTAENKL